MVRTCEIISLNSVASEGGDNKGLRHNPIRNRATSVFNGHKLNVVPDKR